MLKTQCMLGVLMSLHFVCCYKILLDPVKRSCYSEIVSISHLSSPIIKFFFKSDSKDAFVDEYDVHLFDGTVKELNFWEGASHGDFTFELADDKEHKITFCFQKKPSRQATEDVFVNFEISFSKTSRTVFENVLQKSHLQVVEEQVADLENKIQVLGLKATKLKDDVQEQQKTVDNTQSKASTFSFIKSFLLVVVNAWQIYYLKQFFEVKSSCLMVSISPSLFKGKRGFSTESCSISPSSKVSSLNAEYFSISLSKLCDSVLYPKELGTKLSTILSGTLSLIPVSFLTTLVSLSMELDVDDEYEN
eukprot:maker-scaffold_5-snap-gene-6.43-mRNA-1 protein AED:0.16 eAED:0.16 QI:65/0.5/0.4/1/1/1/5/0/304